MLAGWSKHRTITIDHTKIDADMLAYPLCVLLSAASGIGDVDLTSIFTELGTDQLKLAIATSDDTEYPVEEVSWDAATPFAELWSSVPVSTAADTIITIYYDATHLDNTSYVGVVGSVPGKQVWDSGYIEVWHMNDHDDTSHIAGSKNDYDGTKKGAAEPATASGGIGQAQLYDGSNDFITIPQAVSQALTGYGYAVVELYINPTDNDATRNPFVVANAAGLGRCTVGITATDTIQAAGRSGIEAAQVDLTTATITNGSYQYVAAKYDLAADDIFEWIGTTAESNTGMAFAADTFQNSTNATLNFIGHNSVGNYYQGYIDECRLSRVNRSDAYIKANNYCFTDALVTYGAEQLAPSGVRYVVPIGRPNTLGRTAPVKARVSAVVGKGYYAN